MIMIAALLICCSLLRIPSQTPLGCGENLTRPEPRNKSECGGSRAAPAILHIRIQVAMAVGSDKFKISFDALPFPKPCVSMWGP